jgi:hypothetical protein
MLRHTVFMERSVTPADPGKWKEHPMRHCLAFCTPVLALIILVSPVAAQQKADHPRLRAALHELREARNGLKEARDSWPPGYRERAIRSIDDAIESVRTILSVKDVNSFRGVDRDRDFYKRYNDHPHLRAALEDLRDAREELRGAKGDFRGLKERALDDIDVAIGDILTLVRYKKR